MKKLLKLTAIFMIFISIFLSSKNIVFGNEATTPLYLGIIAKMTGDTPNMGYASGTPGTTGAFKIWNFVKYTNATSNDPTEIDAFCLRDGVGFTDGTLSSVGYNVYYDMKKEREAIKAQNTILNELVEKNITENGTTYSRYNALLAVIDMLYLPGKSDESQKQELLQEILEYAKKSSEYNSYVGLIPVYPLTNDDITAVQQAVIWYFTNYGEENGKYDKTSNIGWLNYTTDEVTYEPLSDYNTSTHEGLARSAQADILYNLMIQKAKANANNYANSASESTSAPAQINTTTLSYKAQGSNYIIGPINITETSGNTIPYTIDFVVKNNNSAISNYTLLDENQTAVGTGTTVKDLVGKDFYISVPKASAQSITINMNIKYTTIKATLWAYTQDNQAQPMLIPEVANGEISKELNVVPKELDFALRKYITKVNDVNVTNSRVPNIDVSTLVTGTTSTYKHRKDPVEVTTGSKVTYKLTVYNEGEKEGRATKIVDQLPTGLRFSKVVSGNFELDTYNEETNTLNLKRISSNETNLPAYTTGNLASETIEIECIVTQEAGATDKVLTNVAWISEEIDGETGETITTEAGKDRDSEPGTKPDVNKDNMENYTGNNNKEDLTDSNNYYKGQQDDDDFEKIIIKKAEGTYNLQVVKENTKGEKLQGAKFKIEELGQDGSTVVNTYNNLVTTEDGTIGVPAEVKIAGNATIRYRITEEEAPGKYVGIKEPIIVEVITTLENGEYKVTNNKVSGETKEITQQGNTVVVTVENKEFDLALRKSITKLNNTDTSNTRLPDVDSSNLNKNGNTTGKYNHDKTPLESDTNQEIEYTITVYNEGEVSGYAGEIKDYLPAGIEYVGLVDEQDSAKYEVTAQKDATTGKTTLTITNKEKKVLNPYSETTGTVDSMQFRIKCKVVANRTSGQQVLTNIAEITDYRDEDGTDMTDKDRDSQPGNFPDDKKNNEYDGNGKDGNYVPGQEDDDDFEKIIIPGAEGVYSLQILKVDSKDETKKLSGAHFKITSADGKVLEADTNEEGLIKTDSVEITEEGIDTITIEEVTAPVGYNKIYNSMQIDVTKTITNGKYGISKIQLKNGEATGVGEGEVKANVVDGIITITIPNEEIERTFDLALRKYITKVNGQEVTETREPNIDTTNLVAGIGATEEQKTATYKHRKNPVTVAKKDIVTYNLSIYNEGEKEGRATKIVDQLPTGLRFSKVVSGNFELDTYNEETNTLNLKRISSNETNLPAYTTGNLASETIEIECEVTATPDVKNNKILTNVAWISEEYNAKEQVTITNQKGADRDSEPETITTKTKDELVTEDNGYIGNSANNGKDLNNKDEYFEGQQDDDDFEKLVMLPESFDLKLIKRIVAVNNQNVPERIESVDVSELNTLDENGNMITTGDYILNKEPVGVKKGDIVTYTFRIYNEGTIDGYAQEITEDIPEGLEFIWSEKQGEELKADTTLTDEEKEAVEFNQKYLWKNFVYDDNKEKVIKISSDYLSKENETTVGGNLIPAFGENDGTKTEKDISYKEVSVKLKVTSDATGETIKNEACISEDCDEDGNPVDDRDSDTEDWKDHPNHEDDEDHDYITLQSFDLALRKFIIAISKDTTIENKEYLKNTDGSYKREPVVDTSKLNTTDENGKLITTATYNHTKEPILVQQKDIIVYMLRVYNEGEIDGYASEIKDHLPSHLEFVEGEFNEKYGWELEEDGRTVTTRYLENAKINKPEVSQDGKITLSYKEVPIMCEVKENAKTSEKITNIADITEYLDEDKKIITDRDSEKDNVKVPDDDKLPGYKDDEIGEYIPGQEDDDDFEKVIVKIFDLALRKWVTQAIVTDSNGQTVTETGHQPYDDPEQIVKVELHRKKLNEVVVKFRYSIRVINEGELEGYAKEITDYVPQGLKFVAEDNPGWTDEGNNVISTRLLENTLLQPGEYADVEVVLTWINNENNMGVMTNTAEISEDYNEYGVPDKDSTPDNQKLGEDDIDDAPVMISISTGQMRIYFTLGFIVLITMVGGVVLIKKFVL